MKIITAKYGGFCSGVRRAVDIAIDASKNSRKPVYTFGPIIHNPEVLKVLQKKGINILDSVPGIGSGTVIIRAHGVPPAETNAIKKAGYNLVDATCPRVIKIQSIIKNYSYKRYATIIIGDRNHPEVKGLLGFANGKGHVVKDLYEIKQLPNFDQAIVVAQTTQNKQRFDYLAGWLNNNHSKYKIFDTICESTEKRQLEVKDLAKKVNAIIVIGGNNSGNTIRLYEIGIETGIPSIHIETEKDINSDHLKLLTSSKAIGITAGASTPNWSIQKVRKTVMESTFRQNKGVLSFLYTFHNILRFAALYLSIGAASLTYACSNIQGLQNYFPCIVLSMLYIQSMHTINYLISNKQSRIYNTHIDGFYENHRLLLSLIAITACIFGLFASYFINRKSFFILTSMSLFGTVYNLKIIPDKYHAIKFHRLRDIPGSKTFLLAIAWGVSTAIINPLIETGAISLSNILIFSWASALAFVRSTSFDLLHMQSDCIIGEETIAVLLGKKNSLRLLQSILLFFISVFALAISLNLIPFSSSIVIIGSIFCLFILFALKKSTMVFSFRLEFLIETQLIMVGIISFIWAIL